MAGTEDVFAAIAIILSFSALASYINHRYLNLPQTIALMAISLALSLIAVILGTIGVIEQEWIKEFVESLHFDEVLLHALLAYLLFAGALHIDLQALRGVLLQTATLATFSVVASGTIAGTLFWLVANFLGFDVKLIHGFLFGALIAPTDPVAVLGILKRVGAPKTLETTMAGESLFNDGLGVVIFLTIAEVAFTGKDPSISDVGAFLVLEAAGGAILGIALGWIAYLLMKNIDDYSVEVLLSLAIVSGGYALATALHMSGPIVVVVAGIIIGNKARSTAMSETTRRYLDNFWEIVDDVLNAVLFALVGLEVIAIQMDWEYAVLGLVAIPLVLTARLISVALPGATFHVVGLIPFNKDALTALTWGGLRGGISIALALSLPQSDERNILVTAAYIVVTFSVIVQGLTFGRLIKKLFPTTDNS
ncbi:MAG: sodium:proton antiporter [Dehalococcoidia bacterium]|nr:sodium:proton antiporter [Dehalococcoidia bacterium]